MKAPTFTSERDVKTAVKKLLTANQWFWWMPGANGYGRPGVADILAVRQGAFLAVETKFDANTPTVMQRQYLSNVMYAGGYALVVTEKNLAQFEQWLHLHARTTVPRTMMELSDDDSALQLELAVALTPPK